MLLDLYRNDRDSLYQFAKRACVQVIESNTSYNTLLESATKMADSFDSCIKVNDQLTNKLAEQTALTDKYKRRAFRRGKTIVYETTLGLGAVAWLLEPIAAAPWTLAVLGNPIVLVGTTGLIIVYEVFINKK